MLGRSEGQVFHNCNARVFGWVPDTGLTYRARRLPRLLCTRSVDLLDAELMFAFFAKRSHHELGHPDDSSVAVALASLATPALSKAVVSVGVRRTSA
jgi:hypothetical protein